MPGARRTLDELIGQQTNDACVSGTQPTPPRAARKARRRPTLPPQVFAFIAILVSLFNVSMIAGLLSRDAATPTGDSDWRTQTLADSSVVTLSPRAKVIVDFAADRRTVHLLRGEALFKVAKDPKRPFIVSTHGSQVRAVGTTLAVADRGDRVVVTVSEGIVSVMPRGRREPSDAIRVHAGQQLTLLDEQIENGLVPAPTPARSVERLEFHDVSWGEIVAYFNRRHARQIVLTPELACRRASLAWLQDFQMEQPPRKSDRSYLEP